MHWKKGCAAPTKTVPSITTLAEVGNPQAGPQHAADGHQRRAVHHGLAQPCRFTISGSKRQKNTLVDRKSVTSEAGCTPLYASMVSPGMGATLKQIQSLSIASRLRIASMSHRLR